MVYVDLFIIHVSWSADELKMYHSISNADDCTILQRDKDSVQNWYLGNSVKLNTSKTTFTSFTLKANSINYNYKLRNKIVAR
jgi:hypothetical protein